MPVQDEDMRSMEEGGSENAVTEYTLTDNIKEKLKSLDDVMKDEEAAKDTENTEKEEAAGDPEKTKVQIFQRVPDMLRRNEHLKEYFEPRMVSIGPYHHGKSDLQLEGKMKLKVAAMFMKGNGMKKEGLYLKIQKEIRYLRECYEREATQSFDDDDLAWMFLIDGCVVLHFIRFLADYGCIGKVNGLEILEAKNFQFAMDLFLLENQIPYEVLDLLISATKESDELRKSIKQFIFYTLHIIGTEENPKLPLPEDPIHLFDLLRTSFTQSENSSFMWMILENSMKFPHILLNIDIVLQNIIDMLLNILPHWHTQHVPTFHNIGEMKAAGIKLRPSNTDRLTNINFSLGTLKLPPISIEESTIIKFLNLVAYELCPKFCKGFEICYSIFFLASLIGRAEDVKELRANRILYNYLGSDEEVVKLFKEVSTCLELTFGKKHLDILNQIEGHCNRRYNAWRAQLNNRYFESPWSFIALLGAIMALALTFIQTFYTVRSYYKGETARNMPST